MGELSNHARRDNLAPLIRAVIDTARAFNSRHREAPTRQAPRLVAQAARATGTVTRAASSSSKLE
jgi:hypothetical protein